MSNTETIDITSNAFARRLANLLRDRREACGATMRELARRSGGAFNARQLREFESGRAALDEQVVCEIAALYEAELADILPTRLPLRISDPGCEGDAVISTSGISASFDPADRDSLLVTYLLLVRQLRAQEREPIIDLRREDVETIATYLDEPGQTVMERLSTLMGVTQLQRRAMAGMFIAGAIVVGLAGSGVAALGAGDFDGAPRPPTTVAVAASVTPDDTVVGRDATPDVPLARATREHSRPRDEPLGGAPGMFAAPTSLAVTGVVDPAVVAAAEPTLPETPTSAAPVAPSATTNESSADATSAGPSTRAPAVPAPATTAAAGAGGRVGTSPAPSDAAAADVVSVIDPPLPPSGAAESETAPEPEPELTIPDLPYDLPSTTVATATPPVPTPVTTTPDTTPTPATTASPTMTSDEPAVPTLAPPSVQVVLTGQPPVPPSDAILQGG